MKSFLDFLMQIFSALFWIFVFASTVAAYCYNDLQKLAQKAKEARSNIKVMVQKKAKLAQKLMDTAEKIAGHEKVVQLKVSQDVTDSMNSLAQSNSQASFAIHQVSGMAQKFPELQGNQGYLQLMGDIHGIETELGTKREAYNALSRQYNTKRVTIPTVFFARLMGFNEAPYLEFSDEESLDNLPDFKTDDGEMLEKFVRQVGGKAVDMTKDLGRKASGFTTDLAEKRKGFVSTTNYYYGTPGDKPKGPFTLKELIDLKKKEVIDGKTWLIEEGGAKWLMCHEVLSTKIEMELS